jgi:plastocyanin
MLRAWLIPSLLCAGLIGPALAKAQNSDSVDVRMQLDVGKKASKHPAPAAVLWLKPMQDAPAAPFVPEKRYTLLQKNRMFTPHLLVIPVGSVVLFPNADPFFHNVFSLFDGKRFDLGLYEAGSSKAVTFSREGISYIFCNIHPEMSAVVVTLSTKLFGIADSEGTFRISDVPAGDYEVHVWVEGVAQPILSQMTRRVHLGSGSRNLGVLSIAALKRDPANHSNMYGQPYDSEAKKPY